MIEMPTESEPVTIIQGDCLAVLPMLPAGCVDVVVTDPPYGVDWDTDYTRFTTGFQVPRKSHPKVNGDALPFDPMPWLQFKTVVLFGANCFSNRLPLGSWYVWDKRFTNGAAFLADGEAAWCNKGHGIYIRSVTAQGCIRPETIDHPTQKPVAIMRWIIRKTTKDADCILDPFAGSGTTGVAAIAEGRRCILIEQDPRYVAICRRRIAEAMGMGRGSLLAATGTGDLFQE